MSKITSRTKDYTKYEVAKEVKAYKMTMPCSECDGEMEATGMMYPTEPAYYLHRCNKCGHEEEFLGVTYPRIEYKYED